MNNNGWEQVETIFHNALALSVDERKIFLQVECADNPELREEVETLLDSFENKAAFLDEPVFELGLGAIGETTRKNLAGTEIGGYHLEEKIGAGGMGEVYRAVDTRLNRLVALKFLPPSMENDRAARRRLVKEAQAAAALEHQNICAVHSVEEADKQNFIVMQYVEGKTLDEALGDANIGVEEFKLLARQIVTAVVFAHSHGVIHRDLKPGNIMLTESGEIKVLDFGLAKIMPNAASMNGENNAHSLYSQNGLVIGTPAYMSPEQLRGEKLDYRTDIFSVGIILYELLARKNPFARKSQAETVAAILGEEVKPLRELAPEFPESLINLIEKCLAKDTENRFQSAAEILVELDNAESENYQTVSSKQRRRFFLKTALAIAVLMAVFAGMLFFYNGKRPQRTLAVLPIIIEQGLNDKEYLADGLTQSIIEKLSNLSELKVKNQYLVANYKGKTIEPQTVGKELQADAVFISTLQKIGANLFLSTKLIRTSDGDTIDLNNTPVDEAKVIELTEDISARIIEKIQSQLTEEDKNRLKKKDTTNDEAKRLYFLGRFYLSRKAEGDVTSAVKSFIQARELDPSFAKAWAGLADAYISMSVPGAEKAISPEESVKLARTAAQQALSLDDTLSESYTSLGMISLKYDWKWTEAETHFRDAIRRDAGFLPPRLGLVSLLNIQGRFDEALQEAQTVKELDPHSISPDLELIRTYYVRKEYDQMDRILAALLEKYPNNYRISYYQSYRFLQTGKFVEAIEILEKIYNAGKDSDKILASAPLGFAYSKAGRRNDALKIIETLEDLAKKVYVPSQERAIIYVGLGDFGKAFEYLDKSCKERFLTLPALLNDPLLSELKSDARFAALKQCTNL